MGDASTSGTERYLSKCCDAEVRQKFTGGCLCADCRRELSRGEWYVDTGTERVGGSQ